jgi:hypothetical protein
MYSEHKRGGADRYQKQLALMTYHKHQSPESGQMTVGSGWGNGRDLIPKSNCRLGRISRFASQSCASRLQCLPVVRQRRHREAGPSSSGRLHNHSHLPLLQLRSLSTSSPSLLSYRATRNLPETHFFIFYLTPPTSSLLHLM